MSEGGDGWVILEDHRDRRLSDRRLRREVRRGNLKGDELIHAEGADPASAQPLHAHPAFQQIHGVGPQEAEVLSHARRIRALGYHAATFLAVLAFVGPNLGFAFWGLGLLGHLRRAAPSIAKLQATGHPIAALLGRPAPTAESALPPPAPSVPVEAAPQAGPADPLALRVRAEWEAVEPLLEGSPSAGGLRDAWAEVSGVLVRRAALLRSLEGEDEAALQQEAARLEAEAASADAVTAEALASSRRAVEGRIEALLRARTAEVRLRARVEAMAHHLRAARMALLSQPESGSEGLDAQVDALRQEARAAAELDQAMVVARAGRRRRGSRQGG